MPAGHAMRSTRSTITRRIGLLSTYPPKLCGLATFAAALEQELKRAGNRVDVVRVDDGDGSGAESTSAMTSTLVNGSPASLRRAAATLSRAEVAIVQHEYGIFGGPDGDEVLVLLDLLTVPAIVVLHTVPLAPTTNQRAVLERVCELADQVVVMTHSAGARLLGSYTVDGSKVATIPHGATAPRVSPAGGSHHSADRPQLLTWGLLGPGKGIEHVIDSLALLRDRRPRVRYTVAGVTHPKVLARDGDEYRQSLIRRSWSTGVAGSVSFDDTYRDVAQLTSFVASASVVVLPYDSRDQVTSGVLVDAVAAGRPVIATAFPHAVELLSTGAGLVVPHADPVAMAAAIESLMSDPDRLEGMAAEARRLAPSLRWPAVADQYLRLCDALVETEEPLAI